jgi:light-regulated signal transduction histidine kinase (bacteriophytochrome)
MAELLQLQKGMETGGGTTTMSSQERETLRKLVSSAVHDLKSPLRTIATSSELLAGMYQDRASPEATRWFSSILDAVNRMEALIHDLAEYCYAEVSEFRPIEINMETVLAEARRQLSETLLRSKATITHSALPAVTGDFFALATVFRTLIDNACKFRGEAAPRIHAGCAREGEEWVFSVRDNGIGFNPVYSDLIFQPFERLNGKRYPGSGLGLALAKRIVEQHGGRIWAQSTPGEGSRFWFSLPASS